MFIASKATFRWSLPPAMFGRRFVMTATEMQSAYFGHAHSTFEHNQAHASV